MGLGWKPFDVGVRDEEEDIMKTEAKATRKFESAVKSVEERRADKLKLKERLHNMTPEEKTVFKDSLRVEKRKKAQTKKMIWERIKENKNK